MEYRLSGIMQEYRITSDKYRQGLTSGDYHVKSAQYSVDQSTRGAYK